MDFSAWNANRLIAPILIVSISIVLSGCAAKPSAKPAVTKPAVTADYKLGHVDGYNAAIDYPKIDYPHRVNGFAYYSYHTDLINLTLPEAVQKKIRNKTVEYQRGFANGWKVSHDAAKYVLYGITTGNPPIITENDSRGGIIVPTINHRTKIRPYKRKPQ